MKRNICGIILAGMAVLAAAGCNLVLNTGASQAGSGDSAQDNKARLTAVFKTQIAREAEWTLAAAAKPSSTPTLVIPSNTPTITLTSTSEKVTVKVTKNTNCRTGPEKQFDLVGVMKVGETAEAIGRNADKTYWVIHPPSNPAKTCWLWWEWATLTGNGDALPIIQSPPTPTWSPKPDISISYVGKVTCGGLYAITVQITNTGNVTLESVRMTVTDNTTATTMTHQADFFRWYSGCAVAGIVNSLGVGATANVSNVNPGHFTWDLAGHSLTVNIRVCVNNGLGGLCVNSDFNVTPT